MNRHSPLRNEKERVSMTTSLHVRMRAARGFGAIPGTAAAIAAAGLFTILAAPRPATAQQAAAEATAQDAPAAAQEMPAAPEISGSTVLISSDVARLELDLADGGRRTIELNDGRVLIDGADRGAYQPGGAFDRAWRELLRSPAVDQTAELPELLADWVPPEAANGGSGRSAVLTAFDAFDPEAVARAAQETPGAAATDLAGRVTIVPRAGSIGQLASRLEELNRALGRISGEEFDVDGDFALVVHDDYRIDDATTIDGDVALLGGLLTVEGEIDGDVLVLGGNLDLEPGALVMGDIRSLGGDVETTGATVTGEILKLSAIGPDAGRGISVSVNDDEGRDHRDAEWNYDRRTRSRGFFGSITHNISRSIGDLIGTAVWLIALTLIGAVLVYVSPKRLDAVASEARADVLRSFGVGLAGQLLFFPILLLLVVLIVTWLVVPFYLLAVAVAIPAGYVAVARALGEAVVDRRYDLFERFNLNRQNTYYYVFNGFVVLLAPFAAAAVLELFGGWLGFLRGLTLFVGVVLTWVAATTGFGSVIITRGGGLMRDFRGFRRKRSVPLDDVRSGMEAEADDDAVAGAGAEGSDDDDEVENG